MDDAVAEVFERMLDRSCAAIKNPSAIDAEFSARIAFSGTLEAQCIVEFPSASAQALTSAFLGLSEAGWDDSMVADTVGELCNMIAGGWKKRLGPSAWGADLSVPYISRGSDRDTPNVGSANMRRDYVFDNSSFVVCLRVSQATSLFSPAASKGFRYFTTDWNRGEVSRLANWLSEDE